MLKKTEKPTLHQTASSIAKVAALALAADACAETETVGRGQTGKVSAGARFQTADVLQTAFVVSVRQDDVPRTGVADVKGKETLAVDVAHSTEISLRLVVNYDLFHTASLTWESSSAGQCLSPVAGRSGHRQS